ncbi:hypothetical protein CCH79_00018521 [Gambusia affinis]|uniref:PH domain-containing protein n=1 Tax=Gambusia affinis TaxID=33528 RepID=A0A315UPJ8_GAMAF|nr:hypothetical protein CCH79_00018521 [Gambusia affinis]
MNHSQVALQTRQDVEENLPKPIEDVAEDAEYLHGDHVVGEAVRVTDRCCGGGASLQPLLDTMMKDEDRQGQHEDDDVDVDGDEDEGAGRRHEAQQQQQQQQQRGQEGVALLGSGNPLRRRRRRRDSLTWRDSERLGHLRMSGAGDVVCEGWLRKSPPEKKLRRYAWKRRWFVLRSGRLSGEPDVLQYYKNQHSRRPIGTINLNLCEQVDAGLSFTKKELESSFVFDLRTEERTWYLVAESEEDMNRWVTSICLLCGFNPTDDERHLRSNSASNSVTATRGTPAVTMATGSIPPPYDPVNVRQLEHDSSAEDDYLWLSNCQSHTRPALGSSTSLETDYSGNLHPPPSATFSSSSSCSSSSSLPPTSLPPPSSSGFRSAPWTVVAMASPLSQSLDATMTSDFHKRAARSHGLPSPHPRKHSLDFHLRPAAMTLSDDNHSNAHPSSTTSGYQVPRPASTPQPPPPHRPSSTPSVDSLTQAELHATIPPPPPRPPKPPTVPLQGEIAAVGTGPGALPRANSEPERRDDGIRGTLTKGNDDITEEYLCDIN